VVQIDGRLSPDAIEQQVWQKITERFGDASKRQSSNINLQTS
jgi:hypothetical protein